MSRNHGIGVCAAAGSAVILVLAVSSVQGRDLYWDSDRNMAGIQMGSGNWDSDSTYDFDRKWYDPITGQNLNWDNTRYDNAIFQGVGTEVDINVFAPMPVVQQISLTNGTFDFGAGMELHGGMDLGSAADVSILYDNVIAADQTWHIGAGCQLLADALSSTSRVLTKTGAGTWYVRTSVQGLGGLKISEGKVVGSLGTRIYVPVTFTGGTLETSGTAGRDMIFATGHTGTVYTANTSVLTEDRIRGDGTMTVQWTGLNADGSGFRITRAQPNFTGDVQVDGSLINVQNDDALGTGGITPGRSLTLNNGGILAVDYDQDNSRPALLVITGTYHDEPGTALSLRARPSNDLDLPDAGIKFANGVINDLWADILPDDRWADPVINAAGTATVVKLRGSMVADGDQSDPAFVTTDQGIIHVTADAAIDTRQSNGDPVPLHIWGPGGTGKVIFDTGFNADPPGDHNDLSVIEANGTFETRDSLGLPTESIFLQALSGSGSSYHGVWQVRQADQVFDGELTCADYTGQNNAGIDVEAGITLTHTGRIVDNYGQLNKLGQGTLELAGTVAIDRYFFGTDDLVVDAVEGTVDVTGVVTNGTTTPGRYDLNLIGQGSAMFNGSIEPQGAGCSIRVLRNGVPIDLTIPAGKTVGGNGIVENPVIVAADAILAPGQSPGTLTFNDLTLQDGAIFHWEVGLDPMTEFDHAVVNGQFTTPDGIVRIAIDNLGDPAMNPADLTWSILSWNGGSTLGQTLWQIDYGSTGWTEGQVIVDPDAQQIRLTGLVIPEPATLTLLLLGTTSLLRRLRH